MWIKVKVAIQGKLGGRASSNKLINVNMDKILSIEPVNDEKHKDIVASFSVVGAGSLMVLEPPFYIIEEQLDIEDEWDFNTADPKEEGECPTEEETE